MSLLFWLASLDSTLTNRTEQIFFNTADIAAATAAVLPIVAGLIDLRCSDRVPIDC